MSRIGKQPITVPSGVDVAIDGPRVTVKGPRGQLEHEILRGDWYVVDSESRDAFSMTPERLWSDVLLRQNDSLKLVASYPDDPTLN